MFGSACARSAVVPRTNPTPAIRPRSSRGFRKRLVGLLALLAWLYPLLLIASACALTFIGERHWITAAVLYVPRAAFAAPLPVFVLLLYWCGRRRLLWTQLVALLVLVFPLMGFVLPWPRAAFADSTLRVLSFNVDSGHAGEAALLEAITAQQPDVVLLVEAPLDHTRLRDALATRFPYVHRASQFLLGSRFPIALSTELPRVSYLGRMRTSRAMRYQIDTPQGTVVLYAVHPISPRGAFGLYRFRGVVGRLRQPVALSNDEESDMLGNAGLRSVQIAEALRRAHTEELPVIVAGDTNLPGLSAVLRRSFSGFQDGFAEASWGFGYTFPAKEPFLRLDRIFASPALRFTSFHSGCPGSSDHLCVWADLARR